MGGTESPPVTALKSARLAHRWSKERAVAALRQAAKHRGLELPARASLRRMLTYWENGDRAVSDQYQALLSEIYQLPAAELGFLAPLNGDDSSLDAEIDERVQMSTVDAPLVELLEAQTQNYRMLDRRLGSAQLIAQTSAHVAQLENLMSYALPGAARDAAADALGAAGSLAGWLALDAGRLRTAWDLYELAKHAAREAENTALLAYVTAEQAYVLLDSNAAQDAIELVRYAHRRDPQALPHRLRAWLFSAEAEMCAAAGDAQGTCRALECADTALRANDDTALPYLMLDEPNLARWRGHSLARLGDEEAVRDLQAALTALTDLSSARAEASLRIDLAYAHQARGEHAESQAQADKAGSMASHIGSARQRLRLTRLLGGTNIGKDVQEADESP